MLLLTLDKCWFEVTIQCGIVELVVHKIVVAEDALFRKSAALRQGNAPVMMGKGEKFDAMQPNSLETVVEKNGHGLRHDASALIRLPYPVANLCARILRIDTMVADDTRNVIVIHDDEVELLAAVVEVDDLLKKCGDGGWCIFVVGEANVLIEECSILVN